MLLINDEEFNIYATDSFETVINRIAAKYNSLPKYLKFSSPAPNMLQDFKGQIVVENILDEILGRETVEFPRDIQSRIRRDYPKLDLVKDVEELYIAYNEMIKEVGKSAILTARGFTINVEEVWDKSEKIREDFDKSRRALRQRVEKHTDISTGLDRVPEAFHTNFYFEKSRITIDFGPQEQSIAEIFNTLVTTDQSPFLAFGKIFKVHTNFTPNKEWVNGDTIFPENYIVMKVDSEREIGVRNVKDAFQKFNNVVFAFVDGRLIANLILNLGKRNIPRSEFQRRALKVFGNQPPKIVSSVETNAVGIFYFPHQSIDTTVFSDMIMNDPHFYDIVAVDEAVRLSKVKKNVFMRTIYGSEAIAVQMNVGEKGELPPGILDKEIYLRVRITKTTTQERVKHLQKLVAKLVTLYNKNFQSVADDYAFYLPNSFVEEPLLTASTRKSLRTITPGEIAPEVFPARYSRRCPTAPTIITDEEASTTERVVMEFPIFGETTKRNYICDYAREVFPGLQENKLENSREFPFIPCCYVKDQRIVKGSKYNHYFKGEKLKTTVQSQDIFKTGKILAPGTVGVLPKKINDLFETILPPTHQFMRRGTNKSRFSFLEAILTARGVVNGLESNILERLNQELNRFTTPEYAAAAKQELYHKSIPEIITMMKTKDLRATWFVNMFELVFNCNIFIFTDKNDGSLTVPDHDMCYYKLKPTKTTYFIYQHWGSDADLPEFPQCELMVMTPRNNPRSQISMFQAGTDVPVKVFDVFRQLTAKFKFSEEIPVLQIRKVPIKFQAVDAYGKCRMLSTHYEGVDITLMTDPCPPFAKPLGTKIFRPALKDVRQMIIHYGFQPIVQRKDHLTMKTREIVVLLGTLHGTYLVDDTDLLPDVPVEVGERYGIFMPGPSQHPLADMIDLDKTSRVLAQNAIYAIVKFLQPNESLTKSVFKRFTDSKVIFDKDVDYKLENMRPLFENNPSNKMLTPAGEIVIQTMEIWKRLIFYITMFYQRHKEKFLEYANLTNIPHFFDDISDFKAKTEEYLLEGKTSVNNLIAKKTRDILRHAVSAVILNTPETYFFKNTLLGNKVFMAQNAPTYLHANYILYTWRYDNYNPGTNFITGEEEARDGEQPEVERDDTEEEEEEEEEAISLLDLDLEDLLGESPVDVEAPKTEKKKKKKKTTKGEEEIQKPPVLPEVPLIDFSVYKYVNSEDITLIRPNGSTKDFVLAYKVENIPRYTVLMTG